MDNEKLDKKGLMKVWLKFWTLVKVLVGDVDIAGKGDLQSQINNMSNKVEECFQNASEGKQLIADAITGKGVPTKASDTFAIMAGNIDSIKEVDDSINEDSLNYRTGYAEGVSATKVGTAVAADVLAGKTFTNAEVVGADGAMKNRAAVTVDAGAVTQDDEYTYLTIPTDAFYSANSKVRTQNSNIFTLHTGKRIGDGIITTSRKPVLLVAYAPANSALTVTFISKPNKIIGYWLRMEKVSDTSYKITNAVLDGSSVEVEYWWI